MRVHKNTAMHHSNMSNAVQLGSVAAGGVPVWGCAIPGGLLVLVAGCGAADDAATVGDGAAEPARSCGSVEGCAYS